MGYYSSNGDWANFNSTYNNFESDLALWKDNVIAQYTFGQALTTTMFIRLWDGNRYDVRQLSAYSATIMVSYRAEKVLATAKSIFATGNKTAGYLDPNTRFFIDNSDAMTAFYVQIRNKQIETIYTKPLERYKLIQVVLACVSSLSIVVFGLIYPFYRINRLIMRYYKLRIKLQRNQGY
jgi:hypothetical protein